MTTREDRAVGFLVRLTLGRILLTPVIMALLLVRPDLRWSTLTAAGLFVVATVTDFVDGRLARRWQVTTTLGAFLDTTADKLLVSGVLVALVAVGRVSPWIAAIIIARELVVLGLRGLVATEGTVVRPSVWGKLKMNVQFVAILLAIVQLPVELGPVRLDEWAMLAAAVVTVVSGVEYLTRFSSALSRDTSRE